MKKVRVITLLIFLFLGIFTSFSASAYSYYGSTYSGDFLWVPLVIISIILIAFIAWLLVAVWVYKDAKKRGENGALWAIIIIVGGLIGIILWLVFRPPIGGKKAAPDRICPNCGRAIPFDALLCPYCGKKFESFL